MLTNNVTKIDCAAPRQRPDGPIVMRPNWRELLFLHWPFDPQIVQKLLPDGLEVDTFEGRAYVGLVPFRMEAVRPNWMPNLGRFGKFYDTFAELNVRTYVVHGGVPGVWFCSLDAASALATIAARVWFGLPYFKARIRSHVARDGTISYWSKRLWPAPLPAICSVKYRPHGAIFHARPNTLEDFLVERYVLYSARRGCLYRGRVHHTPYPLQNAELLNLRESCFSAAGLARPDEAPHILYSPGVDVAVWPLEQA